MASCVMRSWPKLFRTLFTGCVILSTAGVLSAQSWSLLAPPQPLPVPRDLSAAVYSSASNRLILFGGYPHVTTYINDLWILKDANGLGTPSWTQVFPNGAPGSPQARGGAVMAYDAQNNRAILAGGESASPALANLNDVWVLTNADGTTGTPAWTQLSPQGSFPGREQAGAVYDAQSNRLIVFMGAHPGGLCRPAPCIVDPADVWVLTNANGLGGTPVWNQLSTSGAPPGRVLGSVDLTYDPVNNRLMMFGGYRPAEQQLLNDVWVLTNANGLGDTPTWTQLSPSGPVPAARRYNTAFYDVQTNRLVIFGGSNGGIGGPLTNFNDTWVLDDANGLGGTPVWHQLSPTGLTITPHEISSGLYDSARNRMMLFGGGVNGFVANETWVLSDANGIPASQIKIDAIQPSHGGQGTVTVQIVGGGFQPGTTVTLTGLGADVVGKNTAVPNASALTATFDLTETTPGIRNVVVTNPDNTTATATGGFTVEQGGAPQIWVDIVGRNQLRIGTAQTLYVTYGNRGNIDAVGVPIWVQVPNDVELSIGFDLAADSALISEKSAVAAQQGGMIPYQVNVGNSTIAGFYKPYLPAGSTQVLPVKLAVNSAIAPFQWQTWAFPPYLATATGQFVANDPIGALECTADLTSVLANAFGVEIPSGVMIESLRALVDASLHRTDAADIQLSTWNIFIDIAQKDGPFVFDGNDLIELSGFKGKLGIIGAVKSCAPLLGIIFQTMTDEAVTALDPNDKVGPLGVTAQRYISGEQSLSYVIDFANLPTATAPAQTVTVTDQLDTTAVDLSTLSLGQIKFGTNQIAPLANATAFSATVDLRPSQNLLVGVNAALNKGNGLITWRFTSLDPITGLPTADPTLGFLPADTNPPAGEGSVFFFLMPKQGLTTNTQIHNQAAVVFDVNPPIPTQTWLNTLDNTAPTSHVLALPAIETSPSFTLQWSGTDLGAGVQDFTIYASDNAGPFVPFQVNMTANSATFIGQAGHTYAFYSIARDLVGNVEALKIAAEATTQLATDATPPITTAVVSPAANASGWNNTNVTVMLNSKDSEPGGTGVKQIQWSLTGAQTGSSTFIGSTTAVTIFTVGTTTLTYLGTDNAGNVETANTLTIRLDKTPPSIIGSRAPAPNGNGWNNSAVTVGFHCADGLSGLAAGSPPAPSVLSRQGAGQSVSGICADIAGNSASASVAGINIDLTPPVLTVATNPPANANGWNNSNVTVSFAAVDALSGVGVVSAPVTVTAEGAGQRVNGSAADLAGNLASGNVVINLDKTPPEVFNQFDPALHDVVLFGRDSLSGVAPGAVQLLSVVTLGHRRDDDGDDMGCPDADDVRAELRTYRVLDLAGNPVLLVEKVKRRGQLIRAKFISVQYEHGPVQGLAKNRESFDWTLTKNGSLKELDQEYRVAPNWDGSRVEADFDARRNQTLVVREEPKPRTKFVKPGLDLLRMATTGGKLSIEF